MALHALDAEVATMRRLGIWPSTKQKIRERLDALRDIGLLGPVDGERLYAASPFHSDQHEARSGKFWMTSHPVPPDDDGVEPLLGSWGGESVYFWLEDDALTALVEGIGKPRIVEVAVPIEATPQAYSATQSIVSAYVSTLGIDADLTSFDLYVHAPLGPASVLAIHTAGEPSFDNLGRAYPDGIVAERTQTPIP